MTIPAPTFDSLELGAVIAKADLAITRGDLVRYAGASGDMNPIHFNDAAAEAAGLPGVLAHGMFTAGLALQPVVDWVGDPTWIVSYETRFTRPVLVDGSTGATLTISAKVARLDPETSTARIDLTVSCGAQNVLGKSQAHVRFTA
ncbi:MaoC/PaaZ C-terminal domain-containing protein [Rhodococcus opacus]|uniref:MaoC/PaaZ C-terminal domain-containing protein n=1 Tax=Rhodococcus opacus TaxID=37919 RepID=UPI0002EE1C24|nr:MaoC/PaaZ C-terminal domain-containing protein [Rhodococcus opacus]MDX5965431.1 MaoC/PaaZ C-terminal domain-containing protein [Rhodococcus opacus]NKY76339.1 acyl dehydratase [Rhodococcus opacus]CAG7579987.1 hypothetical protein E143388_00128 [Rhodococcus opacus]